jgi:signal transduction histidine kinase
MRSLLWHLANRTAETEFIFNLFHLLLAGLTLVVLLHQLRARRATPVWASDRLLTAGFLILCLHFALLGLYFGARFFLHKELAWAGAEPFSDGLLACALLVISGGYLAEHGGKTALVTWLLRGCAVAAAIVLADFLFPAPKLLPQGFHARAAMLFNDLLALLAVTFGLRATLRDRKGAWRAVAAALALVGISLVLQDVSVFLPQYPGIFVWNAERHLLSLALFAFAWAAGERSRNLLDRVFVRLNLTFIILAGMIMFITAGMEKFQYLRLAEERSMELAEFLRGHIVYYGARGEHLESIFRRPEVLRRVVVEFGRMPELRQINVFLDGDRATFDYTSGWEVQQQITPATVSVRAAGPVNSFEMVRLAIGDSQGGDHIELVGTMDYINQYIGTYIILIYSLFTVMVVLATGVIGMIVADTDRRLRGQYAELQETQQQLAQAAKLASVGELAGGMAHEINSPITSILALSSHLAEGKSAATLAPAQRQSLGVIAQQAQRVSNVVKNLLTFSRQSHLELSQVDVGELLETALTLVQYRMTSGAVVLRREVDVDLPPILGDAGRLTEVFVNLLNNALDAMDGGGALVVRAVPNREPQGGVRVEVADTGCGIAPQDLPRIFDPFFTTKEPGRGTGLGLSISHGIVKDHGGQIQARSSPGAGTTLVVTLPKEVSRNDIARSGDR